MTKIRVRFMGKDDPLALRHGKVYDAIVGQKGLYCIVDETGEEYGYPPELFEVVEQNICPCCGLYEHTEPSNCLEICPICKWQDDGVQLDDPDYAGGANDMSLNEARANFAKDLDKRGNPIPPCIICDALIGITFHDPDFEWVQSLCFRFCKHSNLDVRRLATICFGHLARIHGAAIDVEAVRQVLLELLNDSDVAGTAQDALDDIDTFIDNPVE